MPESEPPLRLDKPGPAPESSWEASSQISARSRRSGSRRRALIALTIVAILIIATISTYEVYRSTRPAISPYPAPPAGWATFHTAWSDVSQAFGGFAHGPWTILFVEGLAADAPWAPPAALWGATPPALWEPCANQLVGMSTLTFWNASAYPYSTSPNVYSSGAAPLWTFIFNGTGTPTFVASWIVGQITVNAALGPTSPCFAVYPFGGISYMHVNPSVEVDSSAIAAAAASVNPLGLPEGVLPTPTPPSLAFAAYFPGPQFMPATESAPDLWTLAYGECGFAGQLGSNFTVGDYIYNGTNVEGGLTLWWTQSCYDSYYYLDMNQTKLVAAPNSSGVYREWSMNASFLSSAVPSTWAASELTTSLIHWQLTAGVPPFSLLSPARAVCGPTNPSLANCTPPAQGWYAVLLSPNGSWLDSYPSVSNGSAWSVAGVPLSHGDVLLFVGATGTPADATFGTSYGGEPSVFGGQVLTPT
jgi:hypothetical protein